MGRVSFGDREAGRSARSARSFFSSCVDTTVFADSLVFCVVGHSADGSVLICRSRFRKCNLEVSYQKVLCLGIYLCHLFFQSSDSVIPDRCSFHIFF